MVRKHSGFTLIEILLALLIFAIMATIVTVGLSSVLKARERVKANADRMQQLQLALIIMQQDLTQMVNRSVLDNASNELPSIIYKANYLEFTRGGYVNPLMMSPRSTLQRVAYEFKNHQLIRQTWPVLDRAPDTQVLNRVLLDNIQTIQFNFLDSQNNFYTSWPAGRYDPNNLLPKGIKIKLVFKKSGTLNYLFLTNHNTTPTD